MQDVHVGQVFERRLVDVGIVVFGAEEAERDVVEWLAVLVGRVRRSEVFAAFLVNPLLILSVDQQQHAILLVLFAGQLSGVEHRHAFLQVDVDQVLHAVDDLLVPVDDRLGVVEVNKGLLLGRIRHG
ncbi:hypothetical protein D3C75_1037730 [compost metagenome]